MVLFEVVEVVFHFLASQFGINALAIGGLAAATVGLWYLREAADVFVVLARYARVGSLIGAVLLVALVVGTYFGVVDLDSGGSLIGRLLGAAGGLL